MTAIIDYGAGNLRSVAKAIEALGEETCVTRDCGELMGADRVILPGVGAFGDAMERLERYGLTEAVRKITTGGKPFLGICLGLQLLFESSEESPGAAGLGVFKGRVLRIPDAPGRKVPHMGWNSLDAAAGSRLFAGIPQGSYVYFVHSYYLKAADEAVVAASTEYGVRIHAAVERGNVCACQFHPEKSGAVGLRILRNFLAM